MEFKPTAVYGISNSGGIELMMSDDGDGVLYRFDYDQENLDDEEIFEAEIEYIVDPESDCEDSSAGFYHGDIFYNLGNFIRYDSGI